MIKLRSDGSLDRRKARFVSLVYQQEYGIDYERFALVAKITTIHTILVLLVAKSWPIIQLDVKNAFYEDLKETMYMSPPLGHAVSNTTCMVSKIVVHNSKPWL